MVTVEINDGVLILHVHGADKVWAFKSRLEIPLQHVTGAAPAGDDERGAYHGIRSPGTNLPGVVTAGSYKKDGDWAFWDVHDLDRAIVITTAHEKFARLVVEVDDQAATVARIREALAGR